MRVALGTIEIDDETRKKIRKANGQKGHATRGEVKDFLLKAIERDVIPSIGEEKPGDGGDIRPQAPVTQPH